MARSRGLDVGLYHFFEPDEDAIAQADHFIEQVKELDWNLPPVLDVELSGKQTVDQLEYKVLRWLGRVGKKLKCRPIVYTGYAFWKKQFEGRLEDYRFWLAEYKKHPDPVPREKISNVLFWQFTDKGKTAGVKGQIDVDAFVGDISELKSERWCGRGSRKL